MGAIVIAEDDPDIRSMIAEKLSDSGHQVTATADGLAALVAVRRERPDAVVLDMQMPGMSGLDVVRLLRVDPLTAQVPVIMVTSHIDPPHIGESFLSGADDFLAKPFSPRELAKRVEQMLVAGRRSPPPVPHEQPRPPRAEPKQTEAVTDAIIASDEVSEIVGRRRFLSLLSRPKMN